MVLPVEKEKIIKNFKLHDLDTGSTGVQIILLSEKIKKLVLHLEKNPKDFHSRRGLMGMIEKRRKLLKYLKRKNEEKYKKVIKEIGLKK